MLQIDWINRTVWQKEAAFDTRERGIRTVPLSRIADSVGR